eukprot:CAMPEP_0115828340 /NCGR_PEP_ID=MMETSP0287-20121206/519_1 /TAXON_ID=412157 /ORGANISM="Chrysochromulina rotalis, Strain UIO044" /LENGTH=230 /DNA_ID=CAMNT_0003281545 /DNA_START=493 /DNA_END=1186 /DNA_ORIENTATION=-
MGAERAPHACPGNSAVAYMGSEVVFLAYAEAATTWAQSVHEPGKLQAWQPLSQRPHMQAQGNIHEAWRLRGSSGVISLQPAIQVAWTPSVGHRNMAHVHDRCLPRNWQHAMAMGERSLDKVQILAQGRVGKWGKLVLGCTVGQLYCKSARICQGAKKWACVAAPSLSARWLRVGEEGYTIRAQLGQEREGERSEVGVTLQNGTDECHDLPFVVHLHSEIHPLRKWRELGY